MMMMMMMKPWQAPLNKSPSQGRKEEKRERWKVMGCVTCDLTGNQSIEILPRDDSVTANCKQIELKEHMDWKLTSMGK